MEANIGLEPITQGYEPCVLPITPTRYNLYYCPLSTNTGGARTRDLGVIGLTLTN